MRYYAHIDESGKVYALSNSPNLIVKVEEEDQRMLGTTYDESKGEFVGYRISLSSDKAQIQADGEDVATITASIATWDDQPATDFDGDVIFEVDGTEIPAAVINGQATFEFASNEIGTYEIKTANKEMTILSNDSIEIEVIDNGK